MSDTLTATLPLQRWQGSQGTYHLVAFSGEHADMLAARAVMHRLEFGTRRGFGSVKVLARIGDTEWKTSTFPQAEQSEWVLLISKNVMQAEGLELGERIAVTLTI